MVGLSTGHRRRGTRLKKKIFGVTVVQLWHNSLNESIIHRLLIELERYRSRPYVQLHLCNQDSSFSFTLIINDMKRALRKVFKSKKPSLGTIHGLGPVTSTSTSAGPTDLMLSIPACDSESDETTNAQAAAGVSVSVQLRPPHL